MSDRDKPLVWLRDRVRTPPLGDAARIEAGVLLRRLQRGENLGMPTSRPLPTVGARCHELRINDTNRSWRIIYRIDKDAIIVVAVFEKRTQKLPANIIATCQERLASYDALTGSDT